MIDESSLTPEQKKVIREWRERLIHIYQQYHEHCEAEIWGTRESLIRLGNALIAAAESKQDTEIDLLASDGEGYGLIVRRRTQKQIEGSPDHYYGGRYK